jgi:hypothetical protein
MRIACRMPKATNTHLEYVILFSTVIMVARTRVNLTLHVRCLSRYFCPLLVEMNCEELDNDGKTRYCTVPLLICSILYIYIYYILFIFLLLVLQPTKGFSLPSDYLPFCSLFTLLSPPFYFHYLHIFFNFLNPFLPWSSPDSRIYRCPL